MLRGLFAQEQLDFLRLLREGCRGPAEVYVRARMTVIQTVNNYDKEVFNGDIGRVTMIDEEEGLPSIDFDGRVVEYESGELDEISLAYVLNCIQK